MIFKKLKLSAALVKKLLFAWTFAVCVPDRFHDVSQIMQVKEHF